MQQRECSDVRNNRNKEIKRNSIWYKKIYSLKYIRINCINSNNKSIFMTKTMARLLFIYTKILQILRRFARSCLIKIITLRRFFH